MHPEAAATLGGWVVDLVTSTAPAAGTPGEGEAEPPESALAQVTSRLVERLRTGFREATALSDKDDNCEDGSGTDGLAALQEVLADPSRAASRAELARLIDKYSCKRDFRVPLEHLVREAWDTQEAANERGPVGICISGGGVRAASYGLGALQALQEDQQLVYGPKRARYLAAVSGGSYIAGALTMLASRYEDEDPVPPDEFAGDRYPFAPGTPEVEHLRRRARYLIGGGAIEAVLQFFLRLFLNLAYLAAVIFIVARPAGWLYGSGLPSLAKADQLASDQFEVGPIASLTALGSVIAIAGVFVVFLTTVWRDTVNRPGFGAAGYVLLGAGAGLLFVGSVVPMWLGWVAERWVVSKPTVDPVVEGVPEAAVPWTAWSTIAAIAAVIASFKAVIPDEVGKTVLSRRLRPFFLRLLRLLVALTALTAVPVVVVTAASITMIGGALESTSWTREALLMGIALGVLVLMMALRDPMIWSLHPFYKRRLMACYGIRRVVGSRPPAVEERPSSPPYRLSESAPPELPCLLVCAAANVSGFGNSPAGHNVLPFVLSPLEIGFTDGEKPTSSTTTQPEKPKRPRFRTRDLEKAMGNKPEKRNITLPAAVAITGAAISPSMGKMTIGYIRMLMAVLNLRLGIWLPNPLRASIREAVERGKLPARPTPWYLIKEALGLNGPRSRLIYVSDGGHYENLGLVELLRNGCRTIWCIDAAGDKPGEIGTLTEAMLLAESELGVRWTDTTPLKRLRLDSEATDQRKRLATIQRTHVTLPFVLRDGSAGTVTVVKAGITLDSPNHLIDYQRRYPSFPYDSTANQLFTADRFDAYCSLGYTSTTAAVREAAIQEPVPAAT